MAKISFASFVDQVLKRKTEAAQVRAAAKCLKEMGYTNRPEVTQGTYGHGAALRFYLFMGTPLGDLVLVTGPSTIGEVYTLDELEQQEAPAGFYVEAGSGSASIDKMVKGAFEAAPKKTRAPAKKAPAKKRAPAKRKRAAPKKKAPSYSNFEIGGGGGAPYTGGHGPYKGARRPAYSDIQLSGGGRAPYRAGVKSVRGSRAAAAVAVPAGLSARDQAMINAVMQLGNQIMGAHAE